MILQKTTRFAVILLLFMAFFSLNLSAAYLTDVPQTITQPNGKEIQCFATGDEFYNWLHDEEGFTIIQNQKDGYYYYAIRQGENLVPSAFMVGNTNPAKVGLVPNINISAEKRRQIRQDFLKNEIPERPQIDGYRKSGPANEFNTLNNIVVYVRFSDQPEYIKDTTYYWNMFNNTAPGYNSMQNYFHDVTYGQLELPSWFYPVPEGNIVISYQDIEPRSYFLPYSTNNPNGYKESQRGEREFALLKRAIDFIEEQVPETLNTDDNGDGYVDNVVFNVKGAPSAWSTLLWPHRWVLYGETAMIHDKRVWDFNFQLETELDTRGNGVLCHETYHSLGAPDLYHYSSSSVTPVGRWDIMEQNMNPPQSMGAYMKYRYGGWIDDIPEITECGTYTLNPITSSENNCYKIASPYSSSEFFVLEYRVKEGTFEGSIPGTGLLIYRIDGSLDGDGNASGPPDEVYLTRPGGTDTKNGDLNNANFSADEGRTEINDEGEIFSVLQNGDLGGLDILNIGYAGETITFEVSFNKAPVADFDVSSALLAEGCAADFSDFSGCKATSWEWTFEGGTPATSTEKNPVGIVYNSLGKFDVTLTATNEFGSNTVTFENFIEVSNTALPEVIFEAGKTLVCTNETVRLTDNSKICPESWNWEITPGSFEFVNETNSTSQNPEISFTEPGDYTITLKVANANGEESLTKEAYISAGGVALPFTENFENFTKNSGWTINNPDNDLTWELMGAGGNGGNFAAGVNNFEYFSFLERDQLISPPINLTGHTQAYLNFNYAYAMTSSSFIETDTLVVLVSDDCGTSWTRVLTLWEDGEGSFVTHEPTTLSFTPAAENDWCSSPENDNCDSIDLTPWANQPNVQIMFESVRILGNNIFIDNIQIDYLTGMDDAELKNENQFSVYPNPGSGLFTLTLTESAKEGQISVYNSRGQLIKIIRPQSGQDKIVLDLTGQKRGLYLVNYLNKGVSSTEKLVVR
jgi:M6 family metalloprotease-like protein